jgi:hypothetical protein
MNVPSLAGSKNHCTKEKGFSFNVGFICYRFYCISVNHHLTIAKGHLLTSFVFKCLTQWAVPNITALQCICCCHELEQNLMNLLKIEVSVCRNTLFDILLECTPGWSCVHASVTSRAACCGNIAPTFTVKLN